MLIQAKSEFFKNEFMTMEADESAACAGSLGGRLPTGLCFSFGGLLVLLVNDSEYNNFTGTQPIPCHSGIYFVLPLVRCCCSCGSC
jgi:hypothetical protein